jgi:hypothetical protein
MNASWSIVNRSSENFAHFLHRAKGALDVGLEDFACAIKLRKG